MTAAAADRKIALLIKDADWLLRAIGALAASSEWGPHGTAIEELAARAGALLTEIASTKQSRCKFPLLPGMFFH